MDSNSDSLHIVASQAGARLITLQLDGKHFLFPQQVVEKDGRRVTRGGMHICSPIFGSPEGKAFPHSPQHGELRDYFWGEYQGPAGVNYSNFYTAWGANLFYFVSYFTRINVLEVHTKVLNQGSSPSVIELGWHPYFNAPKGGEVQFLGSSQKIVKIEDAYESEIFPATEIIVIRLNEIGMIEMLLEDGFKDGFVCVWTDWECGYFCVEPLLTYKDHSQGVVLDPSESISAKFTMEFLV